MAVTIADIETRVAHAVDQLEANVADAIVAAARARDTGQASAQGQRLSTVMGTVPADWVDDGTGNVDVVLDGTVEWRQNTGAPVVDGPGATARCSFV